MSETTGSLFDDLKEPTVSSSDAVVAKTSDATEKPDVLSDSVTDLLTEESEIRSANNSTRTETAVASLDITPAAALTRPNPEPRAEIRPASASPQIRVDIPKLNYAAPVATSQTLTLADAQSRAQQADIKSVDRGFLRGLGNAASDVVVGTTGMLTNKNKSHEERILTADVTMAGRLEQTGSDIGTVATNVYHDLRGDRENTGTAQALGKTFTDFASNVRSGNMESIGYGTGMALSLITPGAKGVTGLADDFGKAGSMVRSTSLLDDTSRLAGRLASVEDDAGRLAGRVTATGDELTRLGTQAPAKPTIVTSLQNRFVTPVREAAEGLIPRPNQQLAFQGAGGPSLRMIPDELAGTVARTTGRTGDDVVARVTTTGSRNIDDMIGATRAQGQNILETGTASKPSVIARTPVEKPTAAGRLIETPVTVVGEVAQTGATKVIDNLVDTVQSTSRIVDNAFEPNIATRVQDDLKIVEEATRRIASGNAPVQTAKNLEEAMTRLGTTIGKEAPDAFDDLALKVKEATGTTFTRPAQEVAQTGGTRVVDNLVNAVESTSRIVPKEAVTRGTQAGDNLANSLKSLSNQADDFTRVFDDLASKSTTSGGRTNLETVSRLTREVAEGTASSNTITRLNDLVADIARGLGPDDAKRLTGSVDELTNTARQSTLTREIARGTTNSIDNFTGLSNSLDDVATRFTGETATRQIERVRELSGALVKGTADGDTARLLTEAVEQLGKTVGDDVVKGVRTNTDNLISSSNRTNTALELSRGLATTGDDMTAALRNLTTSGDDFTRVVGEVAPKLAPDAADSLRAVETLGKQIANGANDAATLQNFKNAVGELGKSLGPDDLAKLTSGSEDLVRAAQNSNITSQIARQTANVTDNFTSLNRGLDDIAVKLGDDVATSRIKEVRRLSEAVVRNGADQNSVRALNQSIEDLAKVLGPEHADDMARLATGADDLTLNAQKLTLTRLSTVSDNAALISNSLTRSGADVTEILTDIAQKVTVPAGSSGDDFIRKFTEVKKYTDRVVQGATDADTIRNLNSAVSDLAKVLGPDDMQKVVTKVDELTTSAHRANLTQELVRQTANTGDEFARLTGTFDDIATKLTDDVARQDLAKARQLSENIARGTGDARSVVELNNTIRSLEKVLDPGDFNTLSTRTNSLTQAAQRSNSVRESLTHLAGAGDEMAVAGRVLTNSADDISEALTSVSSKTGGNVARAEVDTVQRLTRQIAEGATDSNTINKLHQAVRELGETLGPQYSDDFGRIAGRVDDLTLNAQRSNISREVVTQTARLQDNFAGMSRSLDDLAVKAPEQITKIDAVKELGRTLASGNARASTVRQFNRAVRELGDSLGTNFSDDFGRVLSRSDDMTMAARRTLAARELGLEVGKVSDNLAGYARQLTTQADNFGTTLDDVIQRSTRPASETAESIRVVRETSGRVANGVADQTTIARFNNAIDDLQKALGPEDFARLRNSADDLTSSARNLDVARVVARETGKTGEAAMLASRAVSSSFDDISGNISRMLDGPAAGRTSLARDLRIVESASGKIARGTQEARTITQLESALSRVSKEIGTDPALRSQFDDLSRNVERLVASNRQLSVAREVGETIVKSGDDVVRETTRVTSNATRVQNTVSQIRNRVTGASDDLLVRELDEITRVSRQLAEGAVDPVNLGKLESSVTRLSQLGGARFGDDLVRLADDSRELIRNARNLRSAQETFNVSSRSASQIPAISTNFATRSQNLSNTINNLAQRASQARVPQVADDLKVLEQTTRQIGTRTESAASLRRAEAALNRLAKTSNSQLGDDIARVVEDTRNFIRTSRTQGPQSFARTSADNIIKTSDDLSLSVARQSRAGLPQNLVRELDNISNASTRIGRQGSDDALEMANIQNSINTLRSSGTQGRRIADDLSSSVERVQRATLDSRRGVNLANATERATAAADDIRVIAQRTLETTNPSRFVRRQLNDIIEASDNALTSSNPSVAVRSIEKSIEKLSSRNAVPQGLERSVRVLDEATNTTSALRRMQTSDGLIGRARTLVQNSADDGSVVAAGTRTRVLESLTSVEDDLSRLASTTSRPAREAINESIGNSVRQLRESGNIRFANEIDEAVALRNLETIGAQNTQLATRLESTTQKLVAGHTDDGARIAETTALTKIETVAREIASGNTNPTLITTLESNISKLSASNQNVIKPIVQELRNGLDDHAGLAVRVRQTSAQMVLDDLARIPTRGDIGAQLDLVADVRQRLSLIKEVNGGSFELVGQISENMLALENSLLRAAKPTNLNSNADFINSLFVKNSNRFSVDGLSSTAGRIKDIAPASGLPRLGELLPIAKTMVRDPLIRDSALYNLGYLGLSFGFSYNALEVLAENVVKLRDGVTGENEERGRESGVSNGDSTETRPAFLRFDARSDNQPELNRPIEQADMDFSPYLGEVVRKSGLFNLSEAEIDVVKRTGVVGSRFEIDRAMHDLAYTGKARSWSQIASVAATAVETALSVNYGFRPFKFSIIDDTSQDKGSRVSFERVAQGRFSPMKIKDIMSKLDARKTEEEEKRNTLYGGNYAQSGGGLSSNLRMANNTYGSVRLVSEGMERVEPKLDNTANATGSASVGTSTFTTYSDPTGIHVAKADPDQAGNQDDEENSDSLYNEALQEASDVV